MVEKGKIIDGCPSFSAHTVQCTVSIIMNQTAFLEIQLGLHRKGAWGKCEEIKQKYAAKSRGGYIWRHVI